MKTTDEKWKLVPVEPTDAMLDAAADVDGQSDRMSKAIYRHMLAAAPTPSRLATALRKETEAMAPKKEQLGETLADDLARIRDIVEYGRKRSASCTSCTSCDGSGDVHRADGEYLGECHDCATQPTNTVTMTREELKEFGMKVAWTISAPGWYAYTVTKDDELRAIVAKCMPEAGK